MATLTADALANRVAARHQTFDPDTEVFAKIGYTPNDKQRLFHDATEYDLLYGGAAGGGKTAALVADDLKDAIRYPGIRIGAFRRTYDELAESLLKQLASFGYAAALGARWNATERELRFPNSSIIRYRYAESLVDASRRLGGEYQKMTFDERSLFAPSVIDHLTERLRSGNRAIPVLGIRSGTNPGGSDHAAVKAKFIDGTDHGANVYTDDYGHSVRFIPAKVDDNPHVDAGYVRVLDAIPDPARRAAMRDGDWDQFSGQYFTEWRRERHVVPAFAIPKSWLRYVGIDWGFSAPWAVIWAAVDEDRRVWVYRELYDTQVGEAEQAKRILDAEDGERVMTRFADDAMWTGRGDAKSVADIYAENSCHIDPAQKGERVTGWQRVHSYLANGPACQHHRAAGWEVCPMLHVLDHAAPNLIRTLPALPHDGRKVEDVDTKAEDHAPDALRYLLINVGDGSSGYVFDDTNTDEDTHQPQGTFTVRLDPNTRHLDFNEDRDPAAGTAVKSPYA
jgi:hypothetical protein